MDMSVSDRLARRLNSNCQTEIPDNQRLVLPLQGVATSLTLVMNRCEELGIFNADEVRDLLSNTVSFSTSQLTEYKGMVNTISCLYEGWDIHLNEARNLIRVLFQIDDKFAQDLCARIVERFLYVDMDVQIRLLTGELTQAEYNRIKEMPVASDRLESLSKVTSRK